ncbi:MAG: hypothetical protein JNJ54_00850 [Myxococcaceae bacterium]|nr:hypothetical protein [Myxococcaceae bacterium]
MATARFLTSESPGGSTSCIARGMRVNTPAGLRRIEDLRVGDEVIAVDPRSGATIVSHLIDRLPGILECGTLVVDGNPLTLTSDHPVFDPEARGFFPASEWMTGERQKVCVVTRTGVREVAVGARVPYARIAEVFSVAIEHPSHTFVVEGVVMRNESFLQVMEDGLTRAA